MYYIILYYWLIIIRLNHTIKDNRQLLCMPSTTESWNDITFNITTILLHITVIIPRTVMVLYTLIIPWWSVMLL